LNQFSRVTFLISRIRILRLQKQNSVQIPQQVATAAAPQPNINVNKNFLFINNNLLKISYI
jgi:hypothetical protein